MRILILFFIVVTLGTSCSTSRPEGTTEAEVLFKEAERMIEAGRYILATEKLNRIRSKYPYSYYATFAELKAADVLFLQENYADAAAAYIVFRDFHPRHKKSDYVLWKIGESFYKQTPDTFDRDLSSAFESIKYLKDLKRIYPDSEYTKNADEKIAACEEMIRLKEKYIADFYYKTDVYDAARFRYKNIIEEFQDQKVRTHAVLRSLQASIELNDKTFCQNNKDIYRDLIQDDSKKEYESILSECLAMKEVKE